MKATRFELLIPLDPRVNEAGGSEQRIASAVVQAQGFASSTGEPLWEINLHVPGGAIHPTADAARIQVVKDLRKLLSRLEQETLA